VRAQRFGHDVDIGKEIVDIGHHAPHHAEPHMMVGIDEARHDDVAGGVDHLSAIHLEVHADRGDPAVVDQHVAGREIGDLGVHRDDGAALEEGTAVVRLAHRSSPFRKLRIGCSLIAPKEP